MDRTTIGILATLALCLVTAVADYFLKRASEVERPYVSWPFLFGCVVYCSTTFGWVFVMRNMKLATLGFVYAIITALFLTFMGVVFFGETIRWYEGIGIGLALASIVLLARSM